jgi:hypothetical protein
MTPFGDERSLEGGPSLGSNFDCFIREHASTYEIKIEGDYLIITRRKPSS